MSKRNIEKEKTFVLSKDGVKSSFNALFFHDIPPETLRRLAKRYTQGHKKYTPDTVYSLNWRCGLDDPQYVAERFNHIWEHLLNFLENGNDKDDNLGALLWNISALIEVERLYPEVLKEVIGQCNFSGQTARDKIKSAKPR